MQQPGPVLENAYLDQTFPVYDLAGQFIAFTGIVFTEFITHGVPFQEGV